MKKIYWTLFSIISILSSTPSFAGFTKEELAEFGAHLHYYMDKDKSGQLAPQFETILSCIELEANPFYKVPSVTEIEEAKDRFYMEKELFGRFHFAFKLSNGKHVKVKGQGLHFLALLNNCLATAKAKLQHSNITQVDRLVRNTTKAVEPSFCP